MSLIDKIENLQKKPEHIKRRVLFASLFVIMFLVVTVWVSTLKISLGSSEEESQVASPISTFFGIVTGSVDVAVSGIKDSFGKIKEIGEIKEGSINQETGQQNVVEYNDTGE
ncbi:hypothetical protein C4572_03670 [Candidatus Parcubacteria bacterium]|nr:MAG: hypothetical protein C4572_03670 [Candidatus Parcubacteria bacterium]